MISYLFFTHWLSDQIPLFVPSKMHSDIIRDLKYLQTLIYCRKYAASLYQKVKIFKIFHSDITYTWCVESCLSDVDILYKTPVSGFRKKTYLEKKVSSMFKVVLIARMYLVLKTGLLNAVTNPKLGTSVQQSV